MLVWFALSVLCHFLVIFGIEEFSLVQMQVIPDLSIRGHCLDAFNFSSDFLKEK